jgi:hypothetical protein
MRTLTVISPRRTPSRNLFVKTIVLGLQDCSRLKYVIAVEKEAQLCSNEETQ